MSEDKKGAVSVVATLKLGSYGVGQVELTDESTGRSERYFLHDSRVGTERVGCDGVVNFLRFVAWLCDASEIKTVCGDAQPGKLKVGDGLWPSPGLRSNRFSFAYMYRYDWCSVYLDYVPYVASDYENVRLSDAAAATLVQIAEDGFLRKRLRFYSTELGTWDFNPAEEKPTVVLRSMLEYQE